ncbi:MAG: PASTA domain-containing protein [bacterium]|nr:MAG: PASTA domain-containing protein [bacterium]
MLKLNEIDWLNIVKFAAIIFLCLLVMYLLIDKIIMPAYTRHGQAIQVPDLTSLMYEDAREVLDRLDLRIVEEAKKFDPSNEFPIGVVMVQNPKPGSQVKKGRRIYVIVSKGEPTIEMPQLMGRSERNAIFMIKNLDLQLGEVRYEHSDIFPHEGSVIDQSVPVAKEVKTGTTVDIVVSLGRFPDRFVVPNVVGRSLNDAKKIIIQAGLTVGEIQYQDEPDLLPETVINQSLNAEEEVSQGDTLHLLVSKLPDKN